MMRRQAGVTLVELVVSMAVATVLSLGFLTAVNQISGIHLFQRRLTFYASEVREVMHQMARDLRATGSNPLSKPFLFDGNPTTDVALILDPNGNGDKTDDIEVHFDRYGDPTTGEPDGDADDEREAIRYSYDADDHRITRSVRMTDGWADEVILVNVCSLSFSFFDSLDQATTDASKVSWVHLDAVTSTAPIDCNQKGEITRSWNLHIKLRNR